MYLLIDCNNFFVSCERIFNPTIRKTAVCVLSNNDGCIIARSNEAKKLGIKMGDPAFLHKNLIKSGQLIVLSSNFPLYGDISSRVMQTIRSFNFETEIYSIDEAFLFLDVSKKDIFKIAKEIRNKILKNTGIPVSLGVGRTKTLAKAAGQYAKKTNDNICILNSKAEENELLKKVKIEDIWGVGQSFTKRLKLLNIKNALALKISDELKIKKYLKTPGHRLYLELNGIACFHIEKNIEKKSITCSRTFPNELNEYEIIEKSICKFAAMAAEKMRKQKSIASFITVYISTNRHKDLDKYYANSYGSSFTIPTNYTPSILKKAKSCLKSIYRNNYFYKKCGVILSGLTNEKNEKLDFFYKEENLTKKKRVINLLDSINHLYGKSSIYFGSELKENKWISNQTKKSNKFTTDWDEILKISI